MRRVVERCVLPGGVLLSIVLREFVKQRAALRHTVAVRRVVLVLALLVAALLVWFLAEDFGARSDRAANSPRPAPSAATTPVPSSDDTSEPKSAVASQQVVLTGTVVGPAGPYWGATVRVHARGQSNSIDEAGTKSDGTYRLTLAIPDEGMTIDLSVRASSDAPLSGERFDDIELRSGDSVLRDFVLRPSPVIEGSVSLDFSPVVRRTGLGRRARVGLVRLEDWEAAVAEAGGVYPVENFPPYVAAKMTSSRFRFAQIPFGRYVVTCEGSTAVALDPPTVEPGDAKFVLHVARVQTLRMVVSDARSFRPVDSASVQLDGFPASTPFTGATGPGAGVALRLRVDGPEPNGPARCRVSSNGYHDYVRFAVSTRLNAFFSDVPLVPKDAPVLTIRLSGGGATAFAENVVISSRVRTTPVGATRGHWRSLELPTLEASPERVRVALPVGAGSLKFHSAIGTTIEALVGGTCEIRVDVRDATDNQLAVEIPRAAAITVDWAGTEIPKWNQVWLIGNRVAWVLGEDGVYRLMQDAGAPTKVWLFRPNGYSKSPPSVFSVFPGEWTVVCRSHLNVFQKIPVSLTPGARVTVAFGR